MASGQRKAEKHRLRRQKKRKVHRSAGVNRERHLTTDRYPVYACTVNKHWREDGIGSILFAREIAPRRVTMAAFLVDTCAMGLKDAWGLVDISVSEFNESASRVDSQLETAALDVETARHLVYGGIELARELGFRLPRKYERWTALLGPLPDGVSPDRSLFLSEGEITLTCSMADLRERLIGCKVEEFLARPDVTYIIGDDDVTLVDDEADEFDEAMLDIEQAFVDSVRKWCFANRQVPHPLLPEVVSASLEIIAQTAADLELPDGDSPDLSGQQLEEFIRQVEAYVLMRGGHAPNEVQLAIAQFAAHMDSMDSPEAAFEAFDLGT